MEQLIGDSVSQSFILIYLFVFFFVGIFGLCVWACQACCRVCITSVTLYAGLTVVLFFNLIRQSDDRLVTAELGYLLINSKLEDQIKKAKCYLAVC